MNADFCEWMYARNEEYKTYVDKYCKQYGYSLVQALQHKMVNDVAHYYHDKEKEKDICPCQKVDDDLQDDKSC